MIRSMLRRASGGRWPAVHLGEHLSCLEVGRLLQRYLDGELATDAEVSSLGAHLEDCRRCGLEADTYRRIKQVLAARGVEVPAESVRRLREFGKSLADG